MSGTIFARNPGARRMPTFFADFDFGLLDDRDFREDSVREELIVPLLSMLGYAASGPNRIIRSRPLEHPFVRIGTRKHAIRIIPDYLLQQDGENAWILDAKAPGQGITEGDNVEQAYSYAVHKDIRVPLYALCNGRELVIFHISEEEPVFHEPLRSLGDDEIWEHLLFYVGTRSVMPHGIPLGFRQDYGLHVGKSGVHAGTKEVIYAFESVPVGSVAKVQDALYCVNAIYGEDGYEFMITFDFDPPKLAQLLQSLPLRTADKIERALTEQPYQIVFAPGKSPSIGVMARLGDKTHTNANESYRPFVVYEFMRSSLAAPDETDASDGEEISF